MITERDLQEAIAECQGERNPNANTCIKLAAFYTIKNELFGKPEQQDMPSYSFSAGGPAEDTESLIDYYSDTEFSEAIDGKPASEVWPVIDELMSILQATNPRLYSAVLRKIDG